VHGRVTQGWHTSVKYLQMTAARQYSMLLQGRSTDKSLRVTTTVAQYTTPVAQ
jgi:hypothetical protein